MFVDCQAADSVYRTVCKCINARNNGVQGDVSFVYFPQTI